MMNESNDREVGVASREAGEMPPDDRGFFELLPGLALIAGTDGRLIRANNNFFLELGFEGKEDPPGSLPVLCDPDDRGKMDRAREEALEKGTSEVTLRLASDRDADQWYHLLLRSHTGESGESYLLVTGSEVTRSVRRERRLITRQAILSSLIRNAGVGIVLLDRGNRVLEANDGFTEIFGYGEEELKGRNIDQLLSPEDEHPDAGRNITSRAGTAGSSRYRPGVVSKNGTPLAVLVDEVPVTGRDPASLCYRIYTDVSSLEKQLAQAQGRAEEQKIRVREINHRVMNNLNLATGFLQLQIYETKDPAVRRDLTDTVVRIKSLAMIHEIFRDSGTLQRVDMQVYLDNLVVFLRQIRDQSGRAELECRVGELYLDVEQAVPCVLLVNEMAGAVLEQNGANDAGLCIALEKKRGEMHLEFKEKGGAIEEMFGGEEGDKDLRYEIVQSLLRQLDARVERESREGRTNLSIRFTVERSPRLVGKV